MADLCPSLLKLQRPSGLLLDRTQRRWSGLFHLSRATAQIGAAVLHRLRHGGATMDALAGASDAILMERGLWGSSKAVLRYRRPKRYI